MGKTSRHVVPNLGGGWSVRKSGAERSSGNYSTQSEAIERGRELAKREKTELYVHRTDGTIREKNSYGSGDPYPPKG